MLYIKNGIMNFNLFVTGTMDIYHKETRGVEKVNIHFIGGQRQMASNHLENT
jgi:hypothetical protein